MPPIYRKDPLRDMSPWGRGTTWIGPNYYRYRPWYTPEPTSWPWPDAGRPVPYTPPRPTAPAPVDEEAIRKIVREEIADLPIPFDVPDTLPEDA